MTRLTIDDESRALSACANAEVLYVGEDVIFAPPICYERLAYP